MSNEEILFSSNLKPLLPCPCEVLQHAVQLFRTIGEITPCSLKKVAATHPYVTGLAAVTTLVVVNSMASVIFWRIRRRKRRQKYKRGVVVLHQFQRGRFAPSFSAFPLKLETFLRMVNIPYECCFVEPLGANATCPWITLNGHDVYGAQTCIDYLNDRLNIHLNRSLTDERAAISLAFRILVEDHLYWCLALYQWRFDSSRQIHDAIHSNCVFRSVVRPLISRMVNQAAYYHGIGQHSQQEIMEMGLQDMQALSNFLGSKQYFMGSEPTEVDASIFACLAIVIYNLPFSPYAKFMNGDCKNLREYVRRLKDRYWSDWDYCLSTPPDTCAMEIPAKAKSSTVRRF